MINLETIVITILIILSVLSLGFIGLYQGLVQPTYYKNIYGKDLTNAYQQVWDNLQMFDLGDSTQINKVIQQKMTEQDKITQFKDYSEYFIKQTSDKDIIKEQVESMKNSLKQFVNVFDKVYNQQKLPIGTIIPIVYDNDKQKGQGMGIDYLSNIQQQMLQYGMIIMVLNDDYKCRSKNISIDKNSDEKYIGKDTSFEIYRDGTFDEAAGTGEIGIEIQDGTGKILRQDTRQDMHDDQDLNGVDYQQFKFTELFQHISSAVDDNRIFNTTYQSSRYNGIGYDMTEDGVKDYEMGYKRDRYNEIDTTKQRETQYKLDVDSNVNEFVINYDLQQPEHDDYYNPITKEKLTNVDGSVKQKQFVGYTKMNEMYYILPQYAYKFLDIDIPKQSNMRNDGKCYYRVLMHVDQTISIQSNKFNETYESVLKQIKDTQKEYMGDYTQSDLVNQTEGIYNPIIGETIERSIQVDDANRYNFYQFIYNYNDSLDAPFEFQEICSNNWYTYISLQNNSVLQHFLNDKAGFKSLYVSSKFNDCCSYIGDGLDSLKNYIQNNGEVETKYDILDPFNISGDIMLKNMIEQYQYSPPLETEMNFNLSLQQNHVCCVYIMIIGYI